MNINSINPMSVSGDAVPADVSPPSAMQNDSHDVTWAADAGARGDGCGPLDDVGVTLSFERLEDVGVHHSYIQYIMHSQRGQEARFMEFITHILRAAAERNEEDEMMYRMIRAIPSAYMHSVTYAGGAFALADFIPPDHELVTPSKDRDNIRSANGQV